MPNTSTPHTDAGNVHVAVVGSGLAGAACAAGLKSAGVQVTLFEKSRNVGCRMASRRAGWIDDSGAQQSASFDHGALSFTPVRPRFKAVMARAMAAGSVGHWLPHVYSAWPHEAGPCLVATPHMPALCRHLLAGATVQLDRTVTRLQRSADGAWHVAAEGAPLAGPFQHVVDVFEKCIQAIKQGR
ncbi:MAG: FAD-dependent oxidoreductase [Cytophagaceae bacterium]|nr:MAG: FAD-dependent oxidoreductase [Cytophagaceae bacterium]